MPSQNSYQDSEGTTNIPAPLSPLDKALIAVIMPVASNTKLASILDTAGSIRHNMKETALIIGLEDGSEDLYSALEPHADDFTLVKVELPNRKGGSGYNT